MFGHILGTKFTTVFFKTIGKPTFIRNSASVAGLSVLLGTGFYLSQQEVNASESLEPPHYPWNHDLPWQAFDHGSIRRGHQVYKNVCASCHSLDRIAFRNLVNTSYTEEEAKKIAAEVDVKDGPNSEGEYFERPGKLSDYMPRPYPNEESARYANNGSYPPDLSLIIKARERHEDYVFSILTGYREPPSGVKLRQGSYYNPFFPGGSIAMPQALTNGQLEFEDGTPASISQMAKDVSVFLAWAAEPEHDDRHRMGIKALVILSLMILPTFYWKRSIWSIVKSRVISFKKV